MGEDIADPEVTVAQYYERVDADDVAGIVELFSADAVYRRPGYAPITGTAALEDFYRNQRIIKSGRHTVTALIRCGDDVAVQGRFTGVLHDGSPAEVEFADFYRMHGGVFAERTTYFYAPLV
jgi:ketosteroid isomerase-like protein